MANLKTTYVDDILNTSKNTKRKYNMITNSDGTVSFEDVTDYSQEGDTFGATDVNTITKAINDLNSDLSTTIQLKYYQSSVSFKAAFQTTDTSGVFGVLDAKIHANIKSYADASVNNLWAANGAAAYCILLKKYNDNYYCGTIQAYNKGQYCADLPFSYYNGIYTVCYPLYDI